MSIRVIEVTDESFDAVVLRSHEPVLVYFWAQWCVPCRMLSPTIEAVAEKYEGAASIVKLNVDDNPAVCQRYGIKGIPTLIVFRAGREEERIIGATSKEAISFLLDKHLAEWRADLQRRMEEARESITRTVAEIKDSVLRQYSPQPCLGIDFGTCYSSAAFVKNDHPTPVKFGPNLTSMPSSVYLDKEGRLLVGKAADKKRQLDPSRYRREFKRELGAATPCRLGESEFVPEELVRAVLAKLRSEADAQSPNGVPFTRAVITVPANYRKSKRDLMLEAGRAAGFAEVTLLDEPVAAATYHASQGGAGRDGEVILVYDLGGGTFDAALIRRRGEWYEPLAMSAGHERLGGIDFDHKIFEDMLGRCGERVRDMLSAGSTAAEGDEARLVRLRARLWAADECREMKHHLSEDDEATLTFPQAPLDEYTLTRKEFNQQIAPLLEETCEICRRLIDSAGLSAGQVDRVLLVGGSCRTPYVQEFVGHELGRPAVLVDDPELAVCLGAAYWGQNVAEFTPQPVAGP